MFAEQLSIFDVLEELDAEQAELRRLGDGIELGMALLQPLFVRGWRLHGTRAFSSSDRMLYILANGVFEVKREGATLGDVAVELFEEAVKLSGAAA